MKHWILACVCLFSSFSYAGFFDNYTWTFPRMADAWEQSNKDSEYIANVSIPMIVKEWNETRGNITKEWHRSNEILEKLTSPLYIFIVGISVVSAIALPTTVAVIVVKLLEYKLAANEVTRLDTF